MIELKIVAAVLVGLILIGLIFMANYISDSKKGYFDMGIFLGIVISVFSVIEIGIVGDILAGQIPTALDVYRGNTELMITSVNGIPTDTVVVFKNK
jgi:hypothetical protein